MSSRHVVVDGSNIATEGRSLPSLTQLDEAVREFLDENGGVTLTVVVDATFGHRIEESERRAFEEAEAANEVVSPPAGAIGRGDAFLLRIADKVSGTVLSNDSFQEFHGEYGWLFDEGRLLGAKPVPGVGWIFTPRTPVRGPRSRVAVRDAGKKAQGREKAQGGEREPDSRAKKAIAEATADALELALPEVAKVEGKPTEETVEAEIAESSRPAPRKAATKKAAKKAPVEPKKAAKKKAAASAPAPAKKKAAPAKKKAPAKKAPVE